MGGIAGMFGVGASDDKVAKMVATMRRRGPDDAGVWVNEKAGIALGHAHLSIIDLSSAGRQPMMLSRKIENGKDVIDLAIVFNGRIYNYKELRKELETKGAEFRTHSDTEVILWGWKIWGKETPKRLRGMFAFALWDAQIKTLTLIRDRMGVKPLLWIQSGHGVVFASSLKAMLASGDVPRVMNDQALFDYLLQGAVLQPRTMIEGVWSLAPGTMKVFCSDKKQEVIERLNEPYWTLKCDENLAEELAGMSYGAQVRETRRKLEEACQYNLVADSPLGSFLSGGVDSTAITALTTQLSGKQIKSFSIGFSKETGMQDELSEAQMAAKHIGTDHTEVILTGKDVADHFDDFIETLDQPSVDGLNTYWVSKVTREHGIKVALSGLGADELFAGYCHFRWAFDAKGEGRMGISWLFDRMMLLLYQQLPYSRQPFERCRNLMPLNDSLVTLRRFMLEGQVRKAVTAPLSQCLKDRHVLSYAKGLNIATSDAMQRITEYECRNYLLNTLLRDTDALSMGHGVETRAIFLDQCLVEHALALPADAKWRGNTPKAILKDATKDLLPLDFFNRRKTGFTLPTSYWVNHELSTYYCDAVRGASKFNCFDKNFLLALENSRDSKQIQRFMWQMLVLIKWMIRENINVE